MKNFILSFILFLVTGAIFAQVPGFTFGPKIGATFSKYHTDIDIIKEEAKSSLHWGAFVRIGSRVYIQPELLFMNRSGLLIRANDITNGEQTIKLRTIDVPLLLGVKLADFKAANIRIFAGPVASMVVNREVLTSNWEDSMTEDDINKANWGIQFGGGVDLLMFTIDLRYETGMSDYSNLDNFSLKNNLITLSLGWKIL